MQICSKAGQQLSDGSVTGKGHEAGPRIIKIHVYRLERWLSPSRGLMFGAGAHMPVIPVLGDGGRKLPETHCLASLNQLN